MQTLRLLLERRDSKVQRAAAGALITLGEHERLVTETLRIHDRILARPDERRLRDVLKQSVRTLAELAKESQAFNQSSSDGDMVDAVVRAGAVEAIVPLLSLSQAIGEECTASIGDIEKEASYAISLLASKDVNQNRIARRWRASGAGRFAQAVSAPAIGTSASKRCTSRGGRGDEPGAREQQHQEPGANRGRYPSARVFARNQGCQGAALQRARFARSRSRTMKTKTRSWSAARCQI